MLFQDLSNFFSFFGILFLVYIYYKSPCYLFILPD